MALVILLVASYFNYWHNAKPKGGLKLAMEGWGADLGTQGSEPFIGKEDVVGEGGALMGEEEEESTPRGPVRDDAGQEPGDPGIEEPARRGIDEPAGPGVERIGEAELGPTGKETIYRGILWMKEKYEQYREQADRKFDQLREELGRSEHRYHELLGVLEQNKNRALDAVEVGPAAKVETVAAHMGTGSDEVRGLAGAGEVPQQVSVAALEDQLNLKQAMIDKLEAQLRSERVKVEELVAILQSNLQMLRKVIPDMGK